MRRQEISLTRRLAFPVVALLACVAGGALAQPGNQPGQGGTTVTWAPAPPVSLRQGGHGALLLHGTVRDGWHVYALKQQENGPTPLRVALDTNDIAVPAGAVQGSKPVVAHDQAFNLDTPYYIHDFTITVPLRVKPHVAAGRHAVPVSVRFQTCNGQTCEPPKTLHLTAAVDVAAGA
jgi:hypothetical protein